MEAIRTALLQMQRQRCAYCERRTGDAKDEGHIEHYRNQAGHTDLETDWNNLFWSCLDEKTCGKHKDKCNIVGGSGKCRAFNPDDLINPCVDDPDQFMRFISDGKITPRDDLTPQEKHRYDETIRVFQLADSPLLRKQREDAVQPYIGILDALRSAGPTIFREYVNSELSRLDSAPFATAIRHFLSSNV
jgi:uncharacterized protein (TIGR02646 family)